jgi:hypothetical protein
MDNLKEITKQISIPKNCFQWGDQLHVPNEDIHHLLSYLGQQAVFHLLQS